MAMIHYSTYVVELSNDIKLRAIPENITFKQMTQLNTINILHYTV